MGPDPTIHTALSLNRSLQRHYTPAGRLGSRWGITVKSGRERPASPRPPAIRALPQLLGHLVLGRLFGSPLLEEFANYLAFVLAERAGDVVEDRIRLCGNRNC